VVFAESTAMLSRANLTPGQFTILVLIDQNPGVSQIDICKASGIQKANLAPAIAYLGKRNLVVREASESDGRTQRLGLSAAGKSLLKHAIKMHNAFEARLSVPLGVRGTQLLIEQLNKLSRSVVGGSGKILRSTSHLSVKARENPFFRAAKAEPILR
jgi:DNA-binding MarR family transcriptional regulator